MLQQAFSGQDVVVFDLGTNDDPNQPEARLAQAFALEALGRTGQAVASFRLFLKLAPHNPAAARARAEIARLER